MKNTQINPDQLRSTQINPDQPRSTQINPDQPRSTRPPRPHLRPPSSASMGWFSGLLQFYLIWGLTCPKNNYLETWTRIKLTKFRTQWFHLRFDSTLSWILTNLKFDLEKSCMPDLTWNIFMCEPIYGVFLIFKQGTCYKFQGGIFIVTKPDAFSLFYFTEFGLMQLHLRLDLIKFGILWLDC